MSYTVANTVLCTYSPATDNTPLVNGSLNSVNAPTTINTTAGSYGGWGMDSGTSPIGARWVFPGGSTDVTGKQYLVVTIGCQRYQAILTMETGSAQDNLRIYFYDSNGYYSGFNVLGRPDNLTVDDIGGTHPWPEGYSNTYAGMIIDIDATPDYASGTALDWTDLIGVEIHHKHATTLQIFSIAAVVSTDTLVHTGTVDMDDLIAPYEYKEPNHNGWGALTFDGYPYYQTPRVLYTITSNALVGGAPSVSYGFRVPGFTIGDNSTTTTVDESNIGIIWSSNHDDQSAIVKSCSRMTVLDGSHFLIFNQAAADSVEFTDCVHSSSSSWYMEVTGNTSGTFTLLRNNIYNADYLKLAHGTLTDCTLYNCGYLEIDANSTVTGTVMRDADDNIADKGLYTQAAPGDFSAIDVEFRDNLGKDITINPTTAGTYDFTGISSTGAIVVHNESATHAITVELPAGISVSSTTAGGTVTIDQPETRYTINVSVTGAEITILETGTQTEDYHVETGTTSQYFEFTSPLGHNVDIQVFLPGYKPYWAENIDLGSTDSTLSVTLEAVPSYA